MKKTNRVEVLEKPCVIVMEISIFKIIPFCPFLLSMIIVNLTALYICRLFSQCFEHQDPVSAIYADGHEQGMICIL